MTAVSQETSGTTQALPVCVQQVTIRDFRNIERAEVEVPAAGVVLSGLNGHGKTNVLEALHYGHALRSLRGVRDQELVRFGQEAFHLAFTATGGAVDSLGIGVARTGRRKRLVSDGVEVTRLGDAFAAIPSVVVSPRDVVLVAGTPQDRRRYLDLLLAATSRRYLSALQRYRAALVRRNAVLRDQSRAADAAAQAAVWEPALAETGATLWAERVRWVDWAARVTAERCAEMGEPQRFAMRLQSSMRDLTGSEAELHLALAGALERERQSDLRRGMTQHGPHRDDLLLMLAGKMARSFGSGGQQRTIALALRLVEAATLREHRGHDPILLLDDPFAELDRERSARILALVAQHGRGQRFLAIPREDEVPSGFGDLTRWRIEGGVIRGA